MQTSNDNNLKLFLFRAFAVMAMVILCSAAAIYFEESVSNTDWSLRTLNSVAAIGLYILCYMLSMVALYHKREKQMLILLWIEAVLCVYILMTARETSIFYYYAAFWVARLPNSYRLRTCLQLTVAVLVVWMAGAWLRDVEYMLLIAVVMFPVFLFVLSVSFTSVNEARLRREAVAMTQELKAAQDMLAQVSRQSERLRIARDIHDLLGHQMTALLLNLEVASHKSKDAALPHIQQSQALAKMTLSDLRNAVSELRDNPIDFRTALATMLARVPELKISLELQDGLTIDDPHTAETLLRCIQEALTNTLRHARANNCSIRLHLHDKQLVLEISDDGVSPLMIVPGNGLKGMRERLQQLAGSLQWHNRNGSFTLQANLPLPEANT